MSESESAPPSSSPAGKRESPWIERARSMVAYAPEALSFIERAAEHFPVENEHVRLLLRLWVEADTLDELILPLLNELNDELLDGRGALETTRGVSTQPMGIDLLDDGHGAEEIVYECGWTLDCDSGIGLCVTLTATESGMFHAEARGSSSEQVHHVGYPVTVSALQDALVATYVAEATNVMTFPPKVSIARHC